MKQAALACNLGSHQLQPPAQHQESPLCAPICRERDSHSTSCQPTPCPGGDRRCSSPLYRGFPGHTPSTSLPGHTVDSPHTSSAQERSQGTLCLPGNPQNEKNVAWNSISILSFETHNASQRQLRVSWQTRGLQNHNGHHQTELAVPSLRAGV